jgi:hypothetical protein
MKDPLAVKHRKEMVGRSSCSTSTRASEGLAYLSPQDPLSPSVLTERNPQIQLWCWRWSHQASCSEESILSAAARRLPS